MRCPYCKEKFELVPNSRGDFVICCMNPKCTMTVRTKGSFTEKEALEFLLKKGD